MTARLPDTGETHLVTRESILDGSFQRRLEASAQEGCPLLSEADRQHSLDRCLSEHKQTEDAWVFAYGSLIWNPAIHFVERCQARVVGWHRRFCLKTVVGRGSKDHPGLVLALEHGGSCNGMLFRVAAEMVTAEFSLLWTREMVTGSYNPRWVTAHTRNGDRLRALAFTINRRHSSYAGHLEDAEAARMIATASGPLGTCADYLERTADALARVNLADPGLLRLRKLVRQIAA